MSKLSLDAFIAKAELTNEKIALESIQGGNLFDCHGDWGQRGKQLGNALIDAATRVGTRLINNIN